MTMLSRSLQPPRPSDYAITLADEIAELASYRRDELIDEALSGRGNLWNTDPLDPHSYDIEHLLPLIPVIAAMLRLPTSSDAERWHGLVAAIRGLATEYAQRKVER